MSALCSLALLMYSLISPCQTSPPIETVHCGVCSSLGQRTVLFARCEMLMLYNFSEGIHPIVTFLRLPTATVLLTASVSQPYNPGSSGSSVLECDAEQDVVMITLEVGAGSTVAYAVQRAALLHYAHYEDDGDSDSHEEEVMPDHDAQEGDILWEKWGPRHTRAVYFPGHKDGMTVVGPSVFGRRGALALYEPTPGEDIELLPIDMPLRGRWKLVLFDFFHWAPQDLENPQLAPSWRVSEIKG